MMEILEPIMTMTGRQVLAHRAGILTFEQHNSQPFMETIIHRQMSSSGYNHGSLSQCVGI
jgi:hypothetical protein